MWRCKSKGPCIVTCLFIKAHIHGHCMKRFYSGSTVRAAPATKWWRHYICKLKNRRTTTSPTCILNKTKLGPLRGHGRQAHCLEVSHQNPMRHFRPADKEHTFSRKGTEVLQDLGGKGLPAQQHQPPAAAAAWPPVPGSISARLLCPPP
jgi:hypothetical protein